MNNFDALPKAPNDCRNYYLNYLFIVGKRNTNYCADSIVYSMCEKYADSTGLKTFELYSLISVCGKNILCYSCVLIFILFPA